MATDRIDEERVMTKWLMGTVIVALVATSGCSQRFETESDYVRQIVDFVSGATDRSFLTPGSSG